MKTQIIEERRFLFIIWGSYNGNQKGGKLGQNKCTITFSFKESNFFIFQENSITQYFSVVTEIKISNFRAF